MSYSQPLLIVIFIITTACLNFLRCIGKHGAAGSQALCAACSRWLQVYSWSLHNNRKQKSSMWSGKSKWIKVSLVCIILMICCLCVCVCVLVVVVTPVRRVCAPSRGSSGPSAERWLWRSLKVTESSRRRLRPPSVRRSRRVRPRLSPGCLDGWEAEGQIPALAILHHHRLTWTCSHTMRFINRNEVPVRLKGNQPVTRCVHCRVLKVQFQFLRKRLQERGECVSSLWAVSVLLLSLCVFSWFGYSSHSAATSTNIDVNVFPFDFPSNMWWEFVFRWRCDCCRSSQFKMQYI